MERKIGEVFEYNDEWYQCIKDDCLQECISCAFYNKGYFSCEESPECRGDKRNDKTNVIFKKLEKVGEPYVSYRKLRQRYKLFIPLTLTNGILDEDISCDEVLNIIDIAIKQNQEDMEEKELNLKPFDIQKAREGKPVCTRDGRKARIVCFDAKGDRPIIALVEAKGNKDALIEEVERYFINGHSVFEVRETNNDLMMLPEKKEGWVNIYRGGKLDADYIYPTKEDAVENIFQPMKDKYIDTINIEWEE